MHLRRFQLLLHSVAFLVMNCCVNAKYDEIMLEDDQRNLIHLVSFGMYNEGYLNVSMAVKVNGKLDHTKAYKLTIDKTKQASSEYVQYGEGVLDPTHGCSSESKSMENKTITLSFSLTKPLDGSTVLINKPDELADVEISPIIMAVSKCNASPVQHTTPKSTGDTQVDSDASFRKKRSGSSEEKNDSSITSVMDLWSTEITTFTDVDNTTTAAVVEAKAKTMPIPLTVVPDGQNLTFSVSFSVKVKNEIDAGLYSIFFHNCATIPPGQIAPVMKFEACIVGKNLNPDTFLSAGDIPKPFLYYCVCATYVLVSFVWLRILRKATSGVFKTHYLMLALCYCKALAALFHGTNIYYIGQKGIEETAWAVIYYISYLMKTIMLFLTILLVGTGWTFIKHVFSDKEKKLFLVALPLQVLVYLSHVIMSETEVATKAYSTWKTISVVVDLLCCAAILLPVVWSIRHLSVTSKTDEKAAQNLLKLQLFKSLYVMVISYIYISRIILYILDFILPYQYAWVGNLFSEVTVLIFLITLGYKFRPADDNPYFQVPVVDYDEEYSEVAITQSGLTTETKRRHVTVDVDVESTDKQALLSRNRNNESSHDLD